MKPQRGTHSGRDDERASRELLAPTGHATWVLTFTASTLLFSPLACGGEGTTSKEADGQGAAKGTTTGGSNQGVGASGGVATTGGSGGTPSDRTGGRSGGGAAPEAGGGSGGEGAPAGAGGNTGGVASGGSLGDGGGPSGDSLSALEALEGWLTIPSADRSTLEAEGFATVALSADDAQTAKDLLWRDLADQIRENRKTEVDEKSITLDGFTLDYETVLLGQEPADGRSLFISMHGGGSAPKETNDEQWQNQILLADSYAPKDALWIAPRAPTDDWNMWFKDHIMPLFDRLISNMIVFEGIHPDKVYLSGYSAGGDGVYQLGPTMADRWAGAAMSAGHPNDMTPRNLRNLAFSIHVGGEDTAFDRNLVAAEWGQQLDDLQAADPEGYPHQVEVHPGLPHWMNLADQPSVVFIQSYTRSTYPKRVIWRQSTLLQTRLYWLRIAPESAVKGAEISATIEGQTIAVESDDVADLSVLLSDEMVDLDQEVKVTLNGATVFEGSVPRTILALHRSLAEREDPNATFCAEVSALP